MIPINFIKKNEKSINFWLIFSIIFYPIIFIWQCGDLTDTGFVAYIYQNYFENIKANQIFSPTFLTDLIGAIWYNTFTNLEIFGFKLLYLLFLYPIIYFVYLILKPFSKSKTLIYFVVFCGIVFQERCFNFVYGKDISSWLFLVASGYFFIDAIKKESNKLILFSGSLLLIACLCRLTSVVGLLLFPIVIVYEILYKQEKNYFKQLKLIFKTYSIFLLGFISTLILFLAILNFFELLDVFLNNFDSVGKLSKNSYSISTLIFSYVLEFLYFIPSILIVVLFLKLGSIIYAFSLKKNNFIYFIIYSLSILFLLCYQDRSYYHGHTIKFLAPAFCFVPLLYSLIKKDKFSTTVLVGIIIAVAQVFGTNTGFFLKLLYGLILLLPLTILILSNYSTIGYKNFKILTLPYSITGTFIIVFLSIMIRIFCIYNISSEKDCRLKAVYVINNPKMKGILTTKENAKHIEDLYSAIESSINKDNSLFIYGHQPMFYFLINSKPTIENIWMTNNQHQPDELFNSIIENINKTKKWPLIVDTKENVMKEEGEIALQKFLKSNKYICKINKPDFNIWVKN